MGSEPTALIALHKEAGETASDAVRVIELGCMVSRSHMSQSESNPSPRWFLVVSIIAILWNLMGCAAYLAQVTMTPEAIAALPEAERAMYESTPTWANAGFAIAVWFGLLGTILLALGRKLAMPVLALSLLGILTQQTHGFFMSEAIEVYGAQAIVMPLMVLGIAIALLGLTRHALSQGWLR